MDFDRSSSPRRNVFHLELVLRPGTQEGWLKRGTMGKVGNSWGREERKRMRVISSGCIVNRVTFVFFLSFLFLSVQEREKYNLEAKSAR